MFHASKNLAIMKTTILILFLIIVIVRPLPAQTDTVILKPYRVWVKPMERGNNLEGILYETRDSSILVSATPAIISDNSVARACAETWSKDIKQIDLRRVGAHGTAVLVGTAAGAVIGLIVGLLTANPGADKELDQHFSTGKMIAFPLLFAGVGAGFGGTVGSVKIKIPIKGSQAELERNRYRLETYSLKKQP